MLHTLSAARYSNGLAHKLIKTLYSFLQWMQCTTEYSIREYTCVICTHKLSPAKHASELESNRTTNPPAWWTDKSVTKYNRVQGTSKVPIAPERNMSPRSYKGLLDEDTNSHFFWKSLQEYFHMPYITWSLNITVGSVRTVGNEMIIIETNIIIIAWG